MARQRVLFVSPEPPYPLNGGGALRTASLLHYAAAWAEVDLVLFAVDGASDPVAAIPKGLVREILPMPLPAHSMNPVARIVRNGGRLLRGVPPLLDRFSGCEGVLGSFLRNRSYDAAILEHFWSAPYQNLVRRHAGQVYLNLHNIESEWHGRLGQRSWWPASAGHRRFAALYRAAESQHLPRFDRVLVTSPREAALLAGSRSMVYPNAIPARTRPAGVGETESIVFSGNLEYHPNQQAVGWFAARVWPALRRRFPGLVWRIVGKNPHGVRGLVQGVPGVQLTGPVNDAIAVLAQSKVAVVPVLSGSGTRVKILEAWAAGLPVVSTALGAEGLDAEPSVHYRSASTAEEFAEAVSGLLENPRQAAQLGDSGRCIYEERYTWEAAWGHLAREKFLMP
ncbi:MAG: glycosyltransferase [Bryobacterales bacterium]|nr:glycosyltransferase [Bryobacterales bacterium]